jgi:hypothetical protein
VAWQIPRNRQSSQACDGYEKLVKCIHDYSIKKESLVFKGLQKRTLDFFKKFTLL